MQWNYAIGIDGGATKTRAALINSDYEIITEVTYNQTANYHIKGMDYVANLVNDICKEVISKSHQIKTEEVAFVGFGATGLATDKEYDHMKEHMEKIGFTLPFVATNDAITALLGGTNNDYGILAIAGTGSIILGLNKAGKEARVGGWGALLGDEGSGYSLGMLGVRKLMMHLDGRLPETKLKETIFEILGVEGAYGMRQWAIDVGFEKDKIAALAPAVFKAYRAGDTLAATIVEGEAFEIGRAIQTAIAQLGLEDKEVEVVAAGGNLIHNKDYFSLVNTTVQEKYPKAKLIKPLHCACIGSAKYALLHLK